MVNLTAVPGYRSRKAELVGELARWMAGRRDPFESQYATYRAGNRLGPDAGGDA